MSMTWISENRRSNTVNHLGVGGRPRSYLPHVFPVANFHELILSPVWRSSPFPETCLLVSYRWKLFPKCFPIRDFSLFGLHWIIIKAAVGSSSRDGLKLSAKSWWTDQIQVYPLAWPTLQRHQLWRFYRLAVKQARCLSTGAIRIQAIWTTLGCRANWGLWSGRQSYWKLPFIVDLPIRNDDFP